MSRTRSTPPGDVRPAPPARPDLLDLDALLEQVLTRRRFLEGSAAAVLAASALGASGCDLGGDDDSEPNDLFALWEEFRSRLRESPEHLPAAAERAVAQRDAEAIYVLVRDRVATYPPSASGVAGAETAMRWGTRATLRGGAGTPREQAELLVELYRRAGFKATVVAGPLRLGERRLRQAFVRPVRREFAPPFDSDELKRWGDLVQRQLPGKPADGPTETIEPVDEGGRESAELARSILAALPSLRAGEPFSWAGIANQPFPVVRVQVDGETRYANPIVPGGSFGESYLAGRAASAPEAPSAGPVLPVVVTLSISRADAPTKRIPVVRGEWSAADLVGRQLLVQFTPAMDLETALSSRVREVEAFVPVLALNAVDLDAPTRERLSVAGTAVTTSGDTIEASKNGTAIVNGVLRPAPKRGTTAPVRTLNASLDASRFPTIKLYVRALDRRGRTIDGLSAGAFRVTEEGRPRAAMLREQRTAPRVLLLFDQSTSVPTNFRGEHAVRLVRRLAEELHAANPRAQFLAAVESQGRAWTGVGSWTRDPAVVAQQMRDHRIAALTAASSQLWSATVHAQTADPDVVVYVTDAQATDNTADLPGLRHKVVEGPPVIAIGVGDARMSTLQAVARLSGGQAFDVGDHRQAVNATLDFLGTRTSGTQGAYLLTYTADRDGPSARNVAIFADRGRTTATYDVPEAGAVGPADALAGIYLTVAVGDNEIRRTIAGYSGGDPERVLSPAVLSEVHAALFGSVLLSFEGASPIPSVWLDDVLTAKLAVRPLWRAVRRRNQGAALEAFQDGVTFVSPLLFTLHPPLHEPADARSLTFEQGLRAVLVAEQGRFGSPVIQRADLLPMTRFATTADNPQDALRRTLERSARLAVVEAALFPTSTAAMLAGRPLKVVEPFSDIGSVVTDLDETAQQEWARAMTGYEGHYKLVPAIGAPVTFWAIDPATGTLSGVLSDGSAGGEVADVERSFATLEATLDSLELGLGLLRYGSCYAALIAITRFIVKTLKKTVLALHGVPPPADDNPLLELFGDLVLATFARGFGRGACSPCPFEKGVARAVGRIPPRRINLPGLRAVTRRMRETMHHVRDNHMVGGKNVQPGSKKDVFPAYMNEAAVRRAILDAYRNGTPIPHGGTTGGVRQTRPPGGQGTAVFFEGRGRGLRIRMWVNLEKRKIETAWCWPCPQRD